MFDTFLESTILMFVAIDPISSGSNFCWFNNWVNKRSSKINIFKSIAVSLMVLSSFWLFGNAILDVMNISMDSFRIIGGLFLIVIAFQMVFEQRQLEDKILLIQLLMMKLLNL